MMCTQQNTRKSLRSAFNKIRNRVVHQPSYNKQIEISSQHARQGTPKYRWCIAHVLRRLNRFKPSHHINTFHQSIVRLCQTLNFESVPRWYLLLMGIASLKDSMMYSCMKFYHIILLSVTLHMYIVTNQTKIKKKLVDSNFSSQLKKISSGCPKL